MKRHNKTYLAVIGSLALAFAYAETTLTTEYAPISQAYQQPTAHSNPVVEGYPSDASPNSVQNQAVAVPNSPNAYQAPTYQPQGQTSEGAPTQIAQEDVVKVQGRTIKYDPSTVNQTEYETNDKLLMASPEDILRMKEKAKRQVKAIQSDPSPSRCDKPRLLQASTAPDSAIPKVRLNMNTTTNLVFTDSAGQSWALDNLVYQSNDLSIVGADGNGETSSLSLSPLRYGAQGSFSVFLQGNPVPLVFEYISDNSVSDCVVQVRLDSLSPASKAKMSQNAFNSDIPSADSDLLTVLNGKAPENAKELTASVAGVRVWKLKDGTSLIKTRFDIVSPSPLSGTKSPDGTQVFRVKSATVYTYRNNDQYEVFTVHR